MIEITYKETIFAQLLFYTFLNQEGAAVIAPPFFYEESRHL